MRSSYDVIRCCRLGFAMAGPNRRVPLENPLREICKVKCHSSADLPIFSSDSFPTSRFTHSTGPLSRNALITALFRSM